MFRLKKTSLPDNVRRRAHPADPADVVLFHFFWGSFLVFFCSVTYAFYLSGMGRIVVTSVGRVSTILQAHFVLGDPIFITRFDIVIPIIILGT